MSQAFFRSLVLDASRLYPPGERFARHFAAGKLGRDPAFRHLLEHGLIPERARVLDIGCGQGTLAALLAAAHARHARGEWPGDWPTPPALEDFHGIDLAATDVERARSALGSAARFTCGDMRTTPFGEADAVVILDVLHYVPVPDQDRVLARCAAALAPGSRLLLRVGDADAGPRAAITRLSDQAITLLRGAWPRLYTRGLKAWIAAVERAGFSVEAVPMSAGTPFANVLLVARRNV